MKWSRSSTCLVYRYLRLSCDLPISFPDQFQFGSVCSDPSKMGYRTMTQRNRSDSRKDLKNKWIVSQWSYQCNRSTVSINRTNVDEPFFSASQFVPKFSLESIKAPKYKRLHIVHSLTLIVCGVRCAVISPQIHNHFFCYVELKVRLCSTPGPWAVSLPTMSHKYKYHDMMKNTHKCLSGV